MSMPEFPLPNLDLMREQVLNMILSSIAMEELALSHILNAEGEKIQHVLGRTSCTSCDFYAGCTGCPVCTGCAPCKNCKAHHDELLAVNKSVTSLLEMVMQNQLILKNKMDRVLEYLPKSSPAPIPPMSPCPPVPSCPPVSPCPLTCNTPCACTPNWQDHAPRFTAIGGLYHCNGAVAWHADGDCSDRDFGVIGADASKIRLPRSGSFKVSVCLELGICEANRNVELLELLITCRDQSPISHIFCQTCDQKSFELQGSAILHMPCPTSPCFASLLVRAPKGICIKKGRITFKRLFQCT